MDPVTLATSVTSILTPYLVKFGENFVEGAGKKLWDVITGKFNNKPAAAGAAKELTSNANDPANQEAFTLQLKEALKEDSDFAKEIAELVSQARAEGISNTGNGAVATNGSIGVGTIQVGGDSGNIIIGNQNSVSQQSNKALKRPNTKR